MPAVDYLIIGSGAVGMIFADQILTETDATIAIVDRHHAPGGHWNDAYPFVRLHQPAAFYGAGSRALGASRIDATGFNAGHYELPSGAEVLAYFDGLMRERFLPSGRVSYYPMSDYPMSGRAGGGEIVSLMSGARTQATYRRLVDATYFQTSVPSTHTPNFKVGEHVELVTPNALPRAAAGQGRFVILGAGKTAMDVGVWLLQMGVRPDAITWVCPRDSWVIDRAVTQPGYAFFTSFTGGLAHQMEAAAGAATYDDLFLDLEARGQLLRLDPTVKPTMYHAATLSRGEADMLRTIRDVVRKGRVRRIDRGAMTLDGGVVETAPDALYIDCTAKAFPTKPPVPIFAGDTITPQMVRAGLVSFSAAMVAHVEAAYADDATKNALCTPIPVMETDRDWVRTVLQDMRNGAMWAEDRALRGWIAQQRLAGAGFVDAPGLAQPDAAEVEAIRARIKAVRPLAMANLERLFAEG